MDGLPNLRILKNWTLVGLHCYLFFSLNFVGVFANEYPPRITSSFSRGQPNRFQASPKEGFRRQPFSINPFQRQVGIGAGGGQQFHEKVDTLDLSQIPAAPVTQKVIENSIDRFDAYGDYEYIDVDRHPKPIGYHKPLRTRPEGPEPHQSLHGRPRQPQRRVDYHRHPNHRYPPYYQPHHNPYVPQTRPGPPKRPTSLLSPPNLDFLNLFGSSQYDKNDQFGPPGTQNEESGLLDPLLKLVGLKEDEQPDYFYDASQKYHDPYEYDYGDYLEGYQNYVKPPRQKTIPERISKWFAGFKVPSSGFKQKPLKNFERVELGNQQSLDYSQYDLDDNQNLIFYDGQNQVQQNLPERPLGSYDFGDVLHSIRANETTGEVAKKFLSAAAALSERSDSSPVFMMWTLPTTILALMGLVYFVGAITIIGYKSLSDGSGTDPTAFIGAALVLSLPLLFGFAIVGSRSAINGELEVNKIVRGDLKNSMRQSFDGVDFVMDGVFGASALLGIGWLVSITV